MKIAVIGAGFAGLSAVKVLRDYGHDVTAFDSAPDVGGVWSRTRRYPGLETQNNKDSYCFSDFPMPRDYPEWPTGEQVQQYLASYVEHFGLAGHIRLDTRVEAAEPTDDGWEVRTVDSVTGAEETSRFEQLVVGNGIFSTPSIPDFAGADEYREAGGRICHTSEIGDLDEVRDRNVVLIGYGKSACDVAAAISEVTASTVVVARALLWKMPKRPGGLNMKYLLLTRMGEGLFPYIRPRGFERFLHGPGKPMRNTMIAGLRAIAVRQLRLKQLGLVPDGPFDDIARSTVSLATEGFSEQVERGAIVVHRDTVVERLGSEEGRPVAVLSDGETVPADVVACGTGWQQRVPFFSEELQRELTDDRGNFVLYHQIQPLDVPRLFFSGYNSSFFSPLSAEVAAWWIAVFLAGGIELPPVAERRAEIEERLRWMEQRTKGHHARGTNIIPFSMHNIDEMLGDIGVNVGAPTRALQWLLPVNPLVYRKLGERLRARHAPAGAQGRRTDSG